MSLTRVRPVPLSALVPWTVVWAHVPFVGGDGYKTRPAVVVGVDGRSITLLPIRTRGGVPHVSAVPLERWDAAGLRRPSDVIRRAVTVDRIDVLDVVGELHHDDRERVGASR